MRNWFEDPQRKSPAMVRIEAIKPHFLMLRLLTRTDVGIDATLIGSAKTAMNVPPWKCESPKSPITKGKIGGTTFQANDTRKLAMQATKATNGAFAREFNGSHYCETALARGIFEPKPSART
jgi:hypothetical protein